MAFNNRNRSLLSLVHHTDRDLHYLLDLARDLKRAKYSGSPPEQPGGQEHRPDLREDLHPHPLRVRGGGLRRGRARHLHRPDVVADRAQGVDEGHRPGARPDVRRDRVPRQPPRRPSRNSPSTPGCRCSTGSPTSSIPTQMLADVLTMTEHCPKPLHDIAYAFVGDGRNNMANSLLLVGAKLGMDVRIGAPKDLWPSDDHVRDVPRVRRRVGGADHHHRRSGQGGQRRRLHPHRRVGVDG